MTAESKIRVILYREGNVWIAQALECDLATSGPDIEQALNRIGAMIVASRSRMAQLDAAPGRFFLMFEHGEDLTPELMAELDDAGIDHLPPIHAKRAEEARAR